MGVKCVDIENPEDLEKREVEIGRRLMEAREGISLTQTEFALQISITRDRQASYEDARAPLRCDIALRACRHFFISELWLATGSVNGVALKKQERADFSNLDARLTMALAVESLSLSVAPGATFAAAFDQHLKSLYFQIAAKQKSFPRVKPLPSDGGEYYSNAVNCMMEFWKRGLAPSTWRWFFSDLILRARIFHSEVAGLDPESIEDETLHRLSDNTFEAWERFIKEQARKST